ncbi:hypothetical protein CEXT_420041 [Caerostris extrusa]|uniref:Uncharacterized protein n=1 Tax=Caerostris extrusa TaxID=172846 RepID=A0AAV4XF35_CAEEX|nr:hypothetical protein CEXT_420041 [Caerostris extrusa]
MNTSHTRTLMKGWRGGLFTKRSSAPDHPLGKNDQRDRYDPREVLMAPQQNRLLNKQDPGMTEYRLLRIRSLMNNEHLTNSNVDEGVEGGGDCSPRDRLPRIIDWGRMTQRDH